VKLRRVRYDTRAIAGKRSRVGMSERLSVAIIVTNLLSPVILQT
jgi:hypothetical protein